MESVRIEQEIKQAERNLDELKQQHKAALKVEDQREFLRSKKAMLIEMGTGNGQFSHERISNMAGMTRLKDFFDLISLHLGYRVSAPEEVGDMSIQHLLIAVNIIQNDEMFKKYRGDLFDDGLVA